MSKMSKTQVEQKLKKAVTHATPDVKDAILEKCKNTNVKYIPISSGKKKRSKYRRAVFSRVVMAAAAILLLVNIGIFGLRGNEKQIYTTIDIDVNPSIELNINSNDRVVSVIAVNDDALKILDGMDLTGAKTKVAVNAIIGSMLSHGYLYEDTRTILVSVDSRDKENAIAIQDSITHDIGGMLDTYSVKATVVSQIMTADNSEVAAIADEYGISQGKAEFVQKIVNANPEYNAEELSSMSVTELDTIWGEVGSDEQVMEIISTGTAEDTFEQADENDTSDDVLTDDESDNTDNDNNSSDDSNATNDDDSDDSSLDEKTVSDNSVSSNSVKDNSVSNNSVSNNSVSSNSVSENSVTKDTAAKDSVSKNSVSKNSVTKSSVSENSVSSNEVSKTKRQSREQ